MQSKRLICVGVALGVFCVLTVGGCAHVDERLGGSGLRKAELLVELPEYCNTPDGMALLPDGSFVLSVPNFNDPTPGAFIMKISADNRVSKFFVAPPHPETQKAGPMGICLAPSGDLYYADNQFGPDTP